MADNVELEAAVYDWEIGDLTPPVVNITDAPVDGSEDRTPTFTFELAEPEAPVST